MFTWIALLAAFFLSAWLTRRFTQPDSLFYILDHPNDRSLHSQPTPRSGGIAILAPIALCVLYLAWVFATSFDVIVMMGMALLVVTSVSFFDDRHHLPTPVRLIAHMLGASLLLLSGLTFQPIVSSLGWTIPNWMVSVISLLYIVWMINLYNFMDGMDGMAGGMAVCGFGALAIFGWYAGNEIYAVISAVIAVSAAGFLCFNFPPARIFMGDTGSSALGLLVAVLSLWGARDGVVPLWASILVFSPFIADASVTLLRRLWRREQIWRAHKTHYYQQLVQSGRGHRKTVLLEYSIMLGCAVTALVGMNKSEWLQIILLSGWGVFYFFFFRWVSQLRKPSDLASTSK